MAAFLMLQGTGLGGMTSTGPTEGPEAPYKAQLAPFSFLFCLLVLGLDQRLLTHRILDKSFSFLGSSFPSEKVGAGLDAVSQGHCSSRYMIPPAHLGQNVHFPLSLLPAVREQASETGLSCFVILGENWCQGLTLHFVLALLGVCGASGCRQSSHHWEFHCPGAVSSGAGGDLLRSHWEWQCQARDPCLLIPRAGHISPSCRQVQRRNACSQAAREGSSQLLIWHSLSPPGASHTTACLGLLATQLPVGSF